MGRDAESCFKCGMVGHWFKDCPERDTAVSHELTGEKIRCYNCGKLGHERQHCIKKLGRKAMVSREDRMQTEKKIQDETKDLPRYEEMLIRRDDPHKDVECFFCNKKGHYASHCVLRAEKDAERAAMKASGRFAAPPR